MTLLRDVVMCDSQEAQLIDSIALSMLGNEISHSLACFMALQKSKREAEIERGNYREIMQQEQNMTETQTQLLCITVFCKTKVIF